MLDAEWFPKRAIIYVGLLVDGSELLKLSFGIISLIYLAKFPHLFLL